MHRCHVLFLILIACTFVAAGDLPPEVDARFTSAVAPADADAFVGTYTMTSLTTVQKPNGKARRNVEMVLDVEHSADGKQSHRLVKFIQDGEDQTEEHRSEIEGDGEDDEEEDDGESDGDSEDFVDPFGETADRFHFGDLRTNGNVVEISFEPKEQYADAEGMSRGAMAWHAETLDPLWVEYKATAPPKPMKELSARIEYSRQEDTVYMSQMIFKGLAKVLLMKRQFHTVVRWHDIAPAPQAPAEPVPVPVPVPETP